MEEMERGEATYIMHAEYHSEDSELKLWQSQRSEVRVHPPVNRYRDKYTEKWLLIPSRDGQRMHRLKERLTPHHIRHMRSVTVIAVHSTRQQGRVNPSLELTTLYKGLYLQQRSGLLMLHCTDLNIQSKQSDT